MPIILIQLLILVLAAWFCFWLVGKSVTNAELAKILRIAVAVIAFLVLLTILGAWHYANIHIGR